MSTQLETNVGEGQSTLPHAPTQRLTAPDFLTEGRYSRSTHTRATARDATAGRWVNYLNTCG